MEIQVLKENLLRALTIAVKFSAQKAQLPVLAHVLLEATKTGIYLAATDLDTGIRLRFAGKVVMPGSVAAPARLLNEYIGVLPLGVVEISSQKEKLTVKAKGSRATMQILADSEFPTFSQATPAAKLGEIKMVDWLGSWQKLETAVSKDLTRPVLTGVLWEMGEGRLVATDGYRLSLVEREAFNFEGAKEKIVVNGSFWGMSAKTMADLQVDTAEIYWLKQEKQLLLKTDDVMMVGRLVEGEFPQYQAILPKGKNVVVTVERESFLQAVRGAMIFARDSAQIVKLTITKQALMVAAAAQSGGAETVLAAEQEGGELTTAFNGKFLSDFLSRGQSEQVTMALDEALKPGMFTEVGEKQYRHVIMPIRLREPAAG